MSEPSYGALVVRMLLGLGVVALVAFAVLRAITKRWGLAALPGGGDGAMRVRDRVMLEPGRTLHLVEVPGRTLVLATGSEGTTLLAELDGPPGVATHKVALDEARDDG